MRRIFRLKLREKRGRNKETKWRTTKTKRTCMNENEPQHTFIAFFFFFFDCTFFFFELLLFL